MLSGQEPVVVYTGAIRPQHIAGVWECGDQRFTDPDCTVFAVHEIPEPPAPLRPVLVITDIASSDEERTEVRQDFKRVSCPVGTTLQIAAELRLVSGQLFPFSSVFLMPVVSRDGRERVLSAPMVSGVATVSAPFAESGVWQVTEAEINSDLPPQLHMSFAGIEIFVVLS